MRGVLFRHFQPCDTVAVETFVDVPHHCPGHDARPEKLLVDIAHGIDGQVAFDIDLFPATFENVFRHRMDFLVEIQDTILRKGREESGFKAAGGVIAPRAACFKFFDIGGSCAEIGKNRGGKNGCPPQVDEPPGLDLSRSRIGEAIPADHVAHGQMQVSRPFCTR